VHVPRVVIAASLAAVCTLTACSRKATSSASVPTPAHRYTIATVGKVEGIAWFEDMKKGVQKFAADTGQEAFMQSPAQADGAQQVQIIENLIAQKVDAICVVPFSVEAVEPVLKKARDQGILVIAHEASSAQNADLIIEPFDNAAYGRHLMERLAQEMGGEGDYATFVGSLNSKSHTEWVDAGVAYQREKYPKMHDVADKIEDYEDQNKAYQKMKELLIAHPTLKGVQTSAMGTAAGAGLAVEERGLQKQVAIVGTSLASVSGQYIKSGSVRMISFWDPALAGYAMNKIAVMMLEGQKITAGTNLGLPGYESLVQSKDKPNLFFGSAWIDITKDNLDQYMQ
jgi:simple sugar transport system substrate-binding protein